MKRKPAPKRNLPKPTFIKPQASRLKDLKLEKGQQPFAFGGKLFVLNTWAFEKRDFHLAVQRCDLKKGPHGSYIASATFNPFPKSKQVPGVKPEKTWHVDAIADKFFSKDRGQAITGFFVEQIAQMAGKKGIKTLVAKPLPGTFGQWAKLGFKRIEKTQYTIKTLT